tara:strand:+ start:8845 stop:11451 length:2607 start_codon:yes stop_codon:yes gene_type:complete
MASDIDAIVKAIQEGFKADSAQRAEADAPAQARSAEKSKERVESLQEEAAAMKEALDAERKWLRSGKDKLAMNKQEQEMNKKTIEQLELRKDLGEKLSAADEKALKDAKEKNKELDKTNENLEENNKILDESIAKGKELGQSMGGMVAVYGKGAISVTGFSAALAQSWKAMNSLQGVGMMLGQVILSLVDTIISFALMVDESTSSIMKTTGASREWSGAMLENAQAMSRLSVSTEDLAAASQSLYTNYTDFTFATIDQQRAMAETGAILQRHGASLDDFGQGMQKTTKFMGISGQAAQDYSVELTQFAKDIGVTPGKMLGDLNANAAGLAKLGNAGQRAFKDLARTAKITGMEMSKLLAITDKFDTFEGAATQAGKLNAAMGGNFVNAMDLMMATDPAERFGMIRDSILDAGLSFDSMTYYQRKFFAEAAGMSDVGDLALALSGDMSKISGSANQNTADYKRLQEETVALNTITEEFKAIMMAMIPVMEPLIEALKEMAADMDRNKAVMKTLVSVAITLTEAIILIVENWKTALGIFVLVKATVLVLSALFKGFAFSLGLTATAQTKLALTGTPAAASIEAMGIAMATAWPAILAFGGAVALVGLGVFLAATGVAQLAVAFAELDAVQLAAFTVAMALFGYGLTIVIGGLIALGAAAPLAGVGVGILLALGGAVALVGLGIGLAAAGMGELAKGIGEMFKPMDEGKMYAFSAFLIALAASSYLMLLAGPGMLLLAAGVVLIGRAIATAPTEDLKAYADFFTALSNIEASTFTIVEEGLKKINEQIRKLPDKAITLKAAMDSVVMANVVARSPAAAAAATRSAGPTASATGTQNINVTLEWDGKEVTRKTLEIVDGVVKEGARGTSYIG